MFLGHFGLGFAGKRLAPALSLGTLFLAVQFADLLFFLLATVSVEGFRIAPGATRVTPLDFHDYPVSHSLVALAGWGVMLGIAYYLLRRDRVAAAVVAAGVLSHWVLDVVVHRPDMPVLPNGPYVGLSLWDSLPWTIVAEALVYGLGIAVYLRATRAKDRVGSAALWALILVLGGLWVASVLGPPPPSESAVAWTGIAMWLFVPWGWWIDRHRAIVAPREVPA